jgi:protein-tyrosine phosphatase
MALAVAQKMVRLMGRAAEFEFASAGTHALRGGQRVDPRAKSVLLARQYESANTRSRQIVDRDFSHYDLILAMDVSNLDALRKRSPSQYRSKMRLLLDYAPGLGIAEVPDPYHGAIAGFERVLDLCEVGVTGLLA